MRLLGAILAGGQSRRFGSDKAAALLAGTPLLEHVAAAIESHVDDVVVVGRRSQAYAAIEDFPMPLLGPLGGLCAALRHAQSWSFDAVLTAGCDVLPLPADLADRLAAGPAVVEGQPLLGLWPTSLFERLLEHLTFSDDRSMRAWVERADARTVPFAAPIYNLNTPADLSYYAAAEGLVR
ncbi:molybdenum cofactor guanylyltransferase [Sphingomonas sp.]|uniref:molybdenum cofactor guanylyltransferase n=1 Tax=Sphingomonas sp. TaxID=28214 RepID=UPI002DEFD0E2|nr:molybdenum cofactor guanylyltransferase [Sphingomonas sp.]